MLILHRHVKRQISTNFHVISTNFFDVISLIEKSTSFPRTFFLCNFDGRKNHVVSKYFFWCNFDGRKIHVLPRTFLDVISLVEISKFFHVISMVEKSTLLPRTSFRVFSLVEKSTSFTLTFFNVILMVENSTVFTRTFFEEISRGKNLTSFLVKLQANENLGGGFLLLGTLKNWLLQDYSLRLFK